MKRQQARMKDDTFFVNHPMEWPRWPILPMVSLTQKSWDNGYLGFMLAEERPPYRVYVGAYYPPLNKEKEVKTIGDLIKDRPIKSYTTAEAMLQEWRID